MSTGLRQQLADYGAFHDEEQGHVDVDDMLAARNSVPPSGASFYVPRRRSNWFGVGVAVAALALTIIVIGVIPLLVNSTPSTLGESVLTAGTWSRVPRDKAVFGGAGTQSMSSVTAGGPGLVAVGGDGLHESGASAVWTSVDGITWVRVPHFEGVFGGDGSQWMGSVTAGGPGLVAVGWDSAWAGDADAAVWTSPDGISWSRVPANEEVFGGLSYQQMTGVTAGGPGLVAVGDDRSRDFEDGDVAVWTSIDGVTWARVPHDEAVFGTGQVTSVTTAESGMVIAVGSAASDGGVDAAVWTSSDGIAWTRAPHDETVFGLAEMLSVTTGGPGLVAVGTAGREDDYEAAVWTSVDGITWTRAPHDESVFGPAEMRSVTAGGPGLVAVGTARSGDDYEAAVWTSADGVTWSRIRHDGTVFGLAEMQSVTAGGPGLVAVGTARSRDDHEAAVWVTGEG